MKKVLTGIKPTGKQIHFGNYFGAVKPLLEFQEKNDTKVTAFVANLHGLTKLHDGETIKQNTYNIVKSYIACGLDPDKVLLFKHSDVPAHTELTWVLSCITHLGFMKRMHAYKDAVNKGKGDEVSMGTFDYPILMAADIVLYEPDLVPVGKDQKQHIEYTRDIVGKFNSQFGETFKLPEAYIKDDVATIPGIDGRKMSKSYSNDIGIFDDEKTLLKKTKRIVTDMKAIEDPKDPDECNVYNILKFFLTDKEKQKLRKEYKQGGLKYSYVKNYLYEKLVEFTKPIKKRKDKITDKEVKKILQNGAKQANQIANQKIKEVYDKVGFNI